MSKKYSTAVVIGRFQPIHNAHLDLINHAFSIAEKVIVILGSSHKPRTYKDPFTEYERMRMIQLATNSDDIEIRYVRDFLYNDAFWASNVQRIVSEYDTVDQRICIVGHKKDDSSFYLDMFPQWTFEEFGLHTELHATDIRDLIFRDKPNFDYLANVVPRSTLEFLKGFAVSHEFREVLAERKFDAEYKQQYASLKYPPIFVTSDAVVVQSGHILLVERKAVPGKGLWALPGGYVNAMTDKSVQSAMIRELREETKIKVPAPVLIGSIVKSKVFDAIGRSSRGRIITHAFHIALNGSELPQVKGGDDAKSAKWIPLSKLRSENMFEDHYEIIRDLVGV